jgi:hypothetical protein
MRPIRNAVGRFHPIIIVWRVQYLDVVQHLDPVSGVPPGNDQAQRKAVQQRQLLAIHLVRKHNVAVAGVVDVERFHEGWGAVDERLIQSLEARRYRAGFYPCAIEHVAQTNASHRALPMAPLPH